MEACWWRRRWKGCLVPRVSPLMASWVVWPLLPRSLSLSALACPPACTADRHFVFSVPASLTQPLLSPSLLSTPGNDTCKPTRVTSENALFKIPMDECGSHKVVRGNLCKKKTTKKMLTLNWCAHAQIKKLRIVFSLDTQEHLLLSSVHAWFINPKVDFIICLFFNKAYLVLWMVLILYNFNFYKRKLLYLSVLLSTNFLSFFFSWQMVGKTLVYIVEIVNKVQSLDLHYGIITREHPVR